MKIIRNIFYTAAGAVLFIILLWLIAVPVSLIQEQIESAAENSGNTSMRLSVEGLRKGVFLKIYADSLDLYIDDRHALRITDFAGTYSPMHLRQGKIGFAVNGQIGKGTVDGTITLPLEGTIHVDRADLGAVPYLARFRMDIKGSVNSDITFLNDSAQAVFDVPDLYIDDTDSVIPLLHTFSRLQGSLSIRGNTLIIDSVSIEGDKGYARLKGNVRNNVMDLELELMPDARKLDAMESMIIGKYIVSPGYYVVPLRGPLP